ncbi:PREDICTED: protein spire homolog 1-like [Buceros rhinoceros silvestris]|uniref:protein spire homolog 1-like n=1 Tax=Buceros rhinoceros silvestris TaxID=175836 RepID=UPI000528DD29|nr:PREDICTED: protein spire homolog 1-like [Buceros rhinoceros silvestris]
MEAPQCEQGISKVSLAEILKCFEHPISEEQAWAICFQCCRKMELLTQGLHSPSHSVFIKGPGSIFIHADGTASFKVYHKSDAGSVQQSDDKLLEFLGVVIYEALDWGIDSQVERELSDPLEKLLCLMLKLDEETMKPAVTVQDIIKVCEEHLSRPSEAIIHYEMTCRSLFTEYIELQNLVTIIQTSKESLRKMDMEDLVEKPLQKKGKQRRPDVELALTGFSEASLWPSVIRELQNGVRLRKATERHVPPKECIRSPYELLLDDIQHKRYTLRKVIIEQKHRTSKADVAASKPHLKPVLERKLKECVPWESSWHEQLMEEIKRPQKLRSSAARENGSRPKEMLVTPNVALKSPSDSFSNLQDTSSEFKIVNTTTQQLGPGVQDCPFPTKLPSPTIAELIGTRYAMMVLEGQGFFQGGSDGVCPRAKICFSCHKQMFLKWPYSCYLCSSVVCCDCCIKMSMPFRTCVHLPFHFLKLLRLSREEDPATQEQKSSELLHEIEHWECLRTWIDSVKGYNGLVVEMSHAEENGGWEGPVLLEREGKTDMFKLSTRSASKLPEGSIPPADLHWPNSRFL